MTCDRDSLFFLSDSLFVFSFKYQACSHSLCSQSKWRKWSNRMSCHQICCHFMQDLRRNKGLGRKRRRRRRWRWRRGRRSEVCTVGSNAAFSGETEFTLPYSSLCLCVCLCVHYHNRRSICYYHLVANLVSPARMEPIHTHVHTYRSHYKNKVHKPPDWQPPGWLKCVLYTHIKSMQMKTNLHQGLCKHVYIILHAVCTHTYTLSLWHCTIVLKTGFNPLSLVLSLSVRHQYLWVQYCVIAELGFFLSFVIAYLNQLSLLIKSTGSNIKTAYLLLVFKSSQPLWYCLAFILNNNKQLKPKLWNNISTKTLR